MLTARIYRTCGTRIDLYKGDGFVIQQERQKEKKSERVVGVKGSRGRSAKDG